MNTPLLRLFFMHFPQKPRQEEKKGVSLRSFAITEGFFLQDFSSYRDFGKHHIHIVLRFGGGILHKPHKSAATGNLHVNHPGSWSFVPGENPAEFSLVLSCIVKFGTSDKAKVFAFFQKGPVEIGMGETRTVRGS